MLRKCRFLGLGLRLLTPSSHIAQIVNPGWLAQKSAISTCGTGILLHVYFEKPRLWRPQLHTVKSETMNIVWRDWKASAGQNFQTSLSQGHSGLSEPPYSTEGFWTSTSRDHILPSGQRASTCSLIKISIETMGGIRGVGVGWGCLANGTEFLILLKW